MRKAFIPVLLALLLMAAPASAAQRLLLATTTSTANTGLLDVLVPAFTKASGITVHYIPVGTGKALAIARRCDAEVVMVHAPALEKRFVAQGYGVERRALMHNYFAIVGPPSDPAGIKGKPPVAALQAIAAHKATFLSRGDNSGTNVKELGLWKKAGIKPAWPGYKETGRGMGATLTMANEMKAYTLSDIGTYRKYKSVGKLDLAVLVTNHKQLANPYSVILVNPAKCPKVKYHQAKAFAKFLLSPQGQAIIANYRADGKQLFWPDAKPSR